MPTPNLRLASSKSTHNQIRKSIFPMPHSQCPMPPSGSQSPAEGNPPAALSHHSQFT
ncbi:queuine tRNA-ribosyltransferase [Tolypothrix sp. PCC 7601]|nr:queuine tRNA-ribosyltransferase [Tolypothrix sp. PCC 7601]